MVERRSCVYSSMLFSVHESVASFTIFWTSSGNLSKERRIPWDSIWPLAPVYLHLKSSCRTLQIAHYSFNLIQAFKTSTQTYKQLLYNILYYIYYIYILYYTYIIFIYIILYIYIYILYYIYNIYIIRII